LRHVPPTLVIKQYTAVTWSPKLTYIGKVSIADLIRKDQQDNHNSDQMYRKLTYETLQREQNIVAKFYPPYS
jgi:hypothetical protein